MDDDNSVGSIDEAKQILVDSWKFLCNEKRKKLYDERRRDLLRVRNLSRASQVPSLPRAAQRPSQEDEQRVEVKVEQMAQERGGESKRKAPPLTNVIHHDNNLMNSQVVLRRPLAEKAKSMIRELDLETNVSASRQANGGSDAATKIPRESKRVKRESKNTNDVVVKEEEEEPCLEAIHVPDADFYNFDDDRTEASFGENQVWAAYDDYDGMPRLYALVHRVVSREPFKLRISWLYSKNNEELGPMEWIDSGFYKTSGCFSIGRRCNNKSLNSFSHRVQWTKGENKSVQIYPKKGDVWALYANFSPSWSFTNPKEIVYKYEMVEVIQDFEEEIGVAVTPLAKVPGFKTVFCRLPNPKTFSGKELFRFSHQVPSRLLTGQEYSQEGKNAPEGCLELDPAAMSVELLNVFTKEETKNSENVFNKPKEKVLEIMNNPQGYKIKEEKD